MSEDPVIIGTDFAREETRQSFQSGTQAEATALVSAPDPFIYLAFCSQRPHSGLVMISSRKPALSKTKPSKRKQQKKKKKHPNPSFALKVGPESKSSGAAFPFIFSVVSSAFTCLLGLFERHFPNTLLPINTHLKRHHSKAS